LISYIFLSAQREGRDVNYLIISLPFDSFIYPYELKIEAFIEGIYIVDFAIGDFTIEDFIYEY